MWMIYDDWNSSGLLVIFFSVVGSNDGLILKNIW